MARIPRTGTPSARTPAPRLQRRMVDRAEQIALLASPTRIDIVDTLEALGGAVSVAELAAELGRPADGLYYHLRQLAAGGLIEEEDAPDGRRYRTATRGDERLQLKYEPGDTSNAHAVARVAASQLRVSGRDFERALADPATVTEGPQRTLWTSRTTGWVDARDLAEINDLLARLSDLVQRPRGDRAGQLIALSWVLAPLAARPARRSATTREDEA